jgi:hypothetical protein
MKTDELWIVEYSFYFDAFGVKPLKDHVEEAQKHFHKKTIHPYDIIFVHESREECSKQCSILQKDRNEYPLSPDHQIEEYQKGLDGLRKLL